jgi:ABC-type nitrate/sulfonate/bicarbonate transport system ATPase subunit
VANITLQEVSKEYVLPGGERLRVLDKISFEIGGGSFTSILGPSGCGKSTILNLIAGLDRHTSGSIRVEGKPKIGFVFQTPRLLNWRTIADNVALPLESGSMDAGARRGTARRYLELVGLRGFEEYYPLKLSGGMQQRAAIARALAIEPDILLMDEPFSGLDEWTARKMRQELMRIWLETGKTIVFVTHSIREAIFLSQQILIVSPKPATVFKTVRLDAPYPREYGDLQLFEMETELTREFLTMEFE